ncbi:type II toxin-antitoxin system RelE/ParE family toxin [Bradyrhizobium sp. Pear77]|uniref:type II toxin-antitoxin system RelE/ParE family toxin n=1 Tax=Bradyrhizobium altum TaxID=1571202 RepID=UPI0028A15A14|nr:type II toxin-antitoxin system RelE/ParE family toxin [Bradyrhizobium altum]MCC8954243.1 type II toxin-antitoxin system RelE/ParE family toxin [Bradyrhizobium altum]
MAECRLSVRARAQLFDIYGFTSMTFGQYQAEAYHAGLERPFGLLADFHALDNRSRNWPRHRRFRFQSHSVFYTEEAGYILIRALYHHAQDIRPQPFD